MRAILLIDHGSKREEANRMLECMAGLVRHLAGPEVIVAHAHMELAPPSIAEGFAECVRRGAAEVVAFPYMLSPGKHSVNDIPRMVAEAAAGFPGTRFQVTPAFGVHEKLAEIILLRAGLEAARGLTPGEAARCWHPTQNTTACGDACRAGTDPAAVAGVSAGTGP